MKDGYFKVAAAPPHITVGDTAANTEQIIKLIDKAKAAGVKLYFLACGTTDFLYDGAVQMDKTLTEQGLDHIFFQSDGGHVWSNWRLYLNTFAPLLFK